MDFDYFPENRQCGCPDCYKERQLCIHVYEYVGSKTCPHCGQLTSEPDFERESKLFKKYYESDEHKQYVCPIEGGTIRGWWSI